MDAKLRVPTTRIGEVEVSRMLCGSNPFRGYSHFSAARDAWLRKYFTVERIVEVMAVCDSYGVNGIVSGPDPIIYEALQSLERQTGSCWHWFCSPGMGNSPIDEGIRWCADHGVKFCLPHTCWTDIRLNIKDQRIEELGPATELIRSLGMIPGLSTHRPEVITVADAAGYDVETYVQPFNVIGFLCAVETNWTAQIIRNAKKPVICIKPFAAGRVMVREGLNFVYHNCKPSDTVCAGFLSPEEADEDIRTALEVLEGVDLRIKLTESRSKQTLQAQT